MSRHEKSVASIPRLNISKLKTPGNGSHHHIRSPINPDHANVSRQTTRSLPCSDRLCRSLDRGEEPKCDGEPPKDTRSIHIILRRRFHMVPLRYQEPIVGVVAHDECGTVVKPDRVDRISRTIDGMICEKSLSLFIFSNI